jgi:hypothetical protein
MPKTSAINKNEKRKVLVAKYAVQRAELKAILANPDKYGVVATAGSDGRIINGLIAQARDQINTRVTGTTTKRLWRLH